MEFLSEFGLFLAKALTILLVAVVITGAVVNAIRNSRQSGPAPDQLEVRHLNADFERAELAVKSVMLPGKAAKAERKALKARHKARLKESRRRVFVLDFDGDLKASAVEGLRQEITALLMVANKDDEVLLRLESPGGLVPAYGLAAAQLMRIRDRGISLTVVVDKMAASGGYMMACVADRILAAPFAILGSIGVIAQLPNFHRLLKKHNIDYEQFMAGEFKRTVTVFGENTDQGRDKFQQEVEEAHSLFKQFVAEHRPQVVLEQVATGEHWYGRRAMELKLADELITSDDYLLKASADADLYGLRQAVPKPWLTRLLSQTTRAFRSI